jgi:hypothetical protein
MHRYISELKNLAIFGKWCLIWEEGGSMPVGCKKAYIAKGTAKVGFGGDHEYVDDEQVFLAWSDEHAPVVAKEVASNKGFRLQKVFRVSDVNGYVEIPLS